MIVCLLIEKGTDVNACRRKYRSVLQVTALKGQYLTVQLLLEKGADVDAEGGGHGNPLPAADTIIQLSYS
jgi:ankyrin repeat protein